MSKRIRRNSKSISKRKKELKDLVIEAKGGACQICGYNKCQQALHFHHLDPSEKDFTVGEYWSKVGKFNTDFFEKILKEIENVSSCVQIVTQNYTG
jgi:hypothetical protein